MHPIELVVIILAVMVGTNRIQNFVSKRRNENQAKITQGNPARSAGREFDPNPHNFPRNEWIKCSWIRYQLLDDDGYWWRIILMGSTWELSRRSSADIVGAQEDEWWRTRWGRGVW